MPDPAEQRAAYKEALARAEAAAVEYTEETPAIPEDAVPVVASDQIPEVVETPAEEVVAEETSTEPEAVVQTEAELRAELEALRERLAEKDTFIGRQSSEVGELREAINALTQRMDTPPQIQVQPQHVAVTQDLIDTDPAYATIKAYEQKDERALQAAYAAWEFAEPAKAAVWLAEERFKERENALRAELEATRSQVQTIAASSQEAAQKTEADRQWKDAFTVVGKEHPGFLENAERILSEVAPRFPHLVETLASGDATVKAEVLTALYVIDRQNNTDPETVRQQLEEAAAEASAEAQATRAAAAGVVTQATAGQANQEKSWEEQEQDRYKQRLASGVDIRRNWTGRS